MTDGARLQELTEKLNQLKMIACLALITNNRVLLQKAYLSLQSD